MSSVSTDPLLVDVTLICAGPAEAEAEGDVEPAEAEDELELPPQAANARSAAQSAEV